MRLTPYQTKVIHQVVFDIAGDRVSVRLFGSRVDDNARGGDIDLLVEIPYPVDEPAWLSAKISGRISRRLGGQKVDVLLSAPNLEHFPIHDIARKEGVVL
ncbi:nucleotidyltransferase domain-containing protein [Sedimenticola hydrogenitrophicus]|uniref:nucleotidyltransferase domain-containing protein n=1 Tax=Sedimenticola hydrogenitrophicus TaxID=2967975 RepID=UPI0021A7662F|nr:nucleotidyltransferase domain-containing protein [Sedimenticola hydrogenitrophicus]